MSTIIGWLSAGAGLILFAAAYYIHQRVRLTRTACVAAACAGFMTYATALGAWLNQYAAQMAVISAIAVFVGICVIVADIKGKRKGADRPALFAFFLVPIFLVSFFGSLPHIVNQVGNGIQQSTSNISVPGGR